MGSVRKADVGSWCAGEAGRKWNSHFAQQSDGISGPSYGHGRGAEGVLEDEIPADDPGDELTHCRIRVSVGAAGDGDHARQLGVAKTGKSAGDSGEDHRESKRRAGVLGCDVTGELEDSCSDDGSDAESDESQRSQLPTQRPRASLGQQRSEVLPNEERHGASRFGCVIVYNSRPSIAPGREEAQ